MVKIKIIDTCGCYRRWQYDLLGKIVNAQYNPDDCSYLVRYGAKNGVFHEWACEEVRRVDRKFNERT